VQSSPDTRVYIGRETPDPGLASCGLVVTRFTAGRATGIVAVFGPKRLDYRRAIPLVSVVGQRLGELLMGRHEPEETLERSA
jgi:heat-inducible transcriptional repressor